MDERPRMDGKPRRGEGGDGDGELLDRIGLEDILDEPGPLPRETPRLARIASDMFACGALQSLAEWVASFKQL